jgi:phosphoglycolate phosphatase
VNSWHWLNLYDSSASPDKKSWQSVNWQHADLILFDLDGTLVDSVPDLALAIDCMLHDTGLPPAGEDKVRQWVGNGAAKLVARALADAQNISEEQLVPAQQSTAFTRFMHHYHQTNGINSMLFTGVKEFLDACQQQSIKLAVVTNKPIEFTHTLLEKLSIQHYFCDVAGGDSFAEKKPHPMPLQKLIQRNHSQRPIMIGDSMHDVQAARAAKVPVICVSYGYNHGVDISLSKPDLVVDSLAGLR